jgi:4-amino-4-deoxy-L-arabinose transferase-like glycosyltransferase
MRRLRVLGTGDGTPAPAGLPTVLLTLAMLAAPPLLLFAYFQVMFSGLTHFEALDFAQLGRNLSSGRGFSTLVLRPLALEHGSNPLYQPETVHGPLYPLLLALAIGAAGAKDWVVAAVSGLFYVLTIPVLYRLGARAFNRPVGTVAALIFATNALLLEYAASGLHITLYVFLATTLMLVLYEIAVEARDASGQPDARVPRGKLAAAGALTGLLYLTDPIFFWIVPVSAGAVLWQSRLRPLQACAWFVLPLSILVLGCMARNWTLTGNPIFGLRGMELWMHTRSYPSFLAYRTLESDLVPGAGLFKDVLQKTVLGIGQVIQTLPQVSAGWVLAFFLPSLFFSFRDPAANVLRKLTMSFFLAIFVGMLAFQVEMQLFAAIVPTILIFAVAYLLHLIQQAQLKRGSVMWVTALLAGVLLYPLGQEMAASEKDRQPAGGGKDARVEVASAEALRRLSRADDVTFSNQPWVVAWYADRPAVWLPAREDRVTDVRERLKTARWLFLTRDAAEYSPQWQFVYNRCLNWNAATMRARATRVKVPQSLRLRQEKEEEERLPLLTALNDFVWLPPADEQTADVVIAAAPQGGPATSGGQAARAQ